VTKFSHIVRSGEGFFSIVTTRENLEKVIRKRQEESLEKIWRRREN